MLRFSAEQIRWQPSPPIVSLRGLAEFQQLKSVTFNCPFLRCTYTPSPQKRATGGHPDPSVGRSADAAAVTAAVEAFHKETLI